MGFQIINMPIWPGARSQMVSESGAEPPRAVGATDIHVESRLELQAAKLANADRRNLGRCKNEGIGSGLSLYHWLDETGW